MTPTKLKHDAIIEAIYDVRFSLDGIPEIALGTLLGSSIWAGFTKTQLPFANIPPPLRRSDAQMRFQPLYEFRDQKSSAIVKIGEQSVSLHVVSPYPGWKTWEPSILALNELLTRSVLGFRVERLGMRYIDALRSDVHRIRSVADLSVQSEWRGKRIENDILIQFSHTFEQNIRATVRIAAGDAIVGNLPSLTSCVTDIDVYTEKPLGVVDHGTLNSWADRAHLVNKEIFFGLLPQSELKELIEE